jgi:GNAT superfamily N-acetyltransferase
MPLKIRDRRHDDVERCVLVLAEVHALERYPYHWPDEPVIWLTRPDTVGAWVAEVDGALVGHACVTNDGKISRLFVAPGQRRQRVGERLLGVATDAARARGLVPYLRVLARDESAVRFYDQVGWRRTEVREVTFDDGSAQTVYHYVAS